MFEYNPDGTLEFDCDSLTVKDWESVAKFVSNKMKFSGLVAAGGGTNFGDALNKHIDIIGPIIIVGDVFGDGSNMLAARECYINNFGEDDDIAGIVMYSDHVPEPKWIKSVFSIGNVGQR